MKPLYVFSTFFFLGMLVLAGCVAVPESLQPPQVVGAQESASEPTLTVTSLDNSIPLGSSFPILVQLSSLPPNQNVDLQLEDLGVTPSSHTASTTSDSVGRATLQLSGRATRPQLDALNVLGFFEGGTVGGMLLVNFDPPLQNELQAQATIIGKPTTHEAYVRASPVVGGLRGLEAAHAEMPPVLRVNNVRFPEPNGRLGKPLNLLQYNAGVQIGDGVKASQFDAQFGPSQASGCSSGNTYVYLTTFIDYYQVPMPAGTRVYISGHAPKQTRHVGENGKLCFDFTSGTIIQFSILGWTSTGIYMHDGSDSYRLEGYSKVFGAAYNTTLTAANILGKTVNVTSSTKDYSYRSLRVFYKINKVYNWERFVPNNPYSSFPLSVVYPDSALETTRAGYGRMFIDAAFYSSDRTLFHEFGHEVYYRRMLGADTYRYYHEQAVVRGQTALPLCAGSIGWSPWKHTDGCAGMLEGFALWFEGVSTRAGLGTSFSTAIEFDISPGTNGGGAVPGHVAQFLYDLTDAHAPVGSTTPISSKVPDSDADEVKNTTMPDLGTRYSNVARYFHGANPGSSTFTYMYQNRIQPALHPDHRPDHCAVVRRNTLAVRGMCG